MVGLEVLQHEEEEVTDYHSNDNAVTIDLELVLWHL